MDLRGLFESPQFLVVAFTLWLISSFFIVFLLGQIDGIVHNDLYSYGLEFSPSWANQYWLALRLIYACLVVPSVCTAVILGWGLWRRFSGNTVELRSQAPESAPVRVKRLKGNSMLISCPSCKKTFGKPLVMLDFGAGKPRLINACPYCSAGLGEADYKGEDLETGILPADEKLKANSRGNRR